MKSNRKQFSDYFSKKIKFEFDDSNPWTAINQGAECCADGHQTFYGAIMKSPQWHSWYKEQMKRFSEANIVDHKLNKKCFDIDECIGIGAIGDEHLQEFFRFIKES